MSSTCVVCCLCLWLFSGLSEPVFCMSLILCPCTCMNAVLSISGLCIPHKEFLLCIYWPIQKALHGGRKKGHITEFLKQGFTRDEVLLIPTDPDNKPQHCKNLCRLITLHSCCFQHGAHLFYKVGFKLFAVFSMYYHNIHIQLCGSGAWKGT